MLGHMSGSSSLDKIEVHLIRAFHTLITERSVTRAALRLHTTQPAMSAKLRRLRALTGDPLLVRSGSGLVPTPAALALMPAASDVLQGVQRLFGADAGERTFDPQRAQGQLRMASSDFIDPLFLPSLMARMRREAPGLQLDVLPLSAELDYRRALAHGDLDLVLGNWQEPPQELHMSRLLADELVCLVAADHPAVRLGRAWTADRYLACDHLAPMPFHAGAHGFVDAHLQALGLQRRVVMRIPHFSLAPALVARSSLVFTTGRRFCERFLDHEAVRVLRCPVPLPMLVYYQLWHQLGHASAAVRWLRETARDVVHGLGQGDRRAL